MFIFTDSFPEKEQGDLHINVDSSFTKEGDLIGYIEKETLSPYNDGGHNWSGFCDSITELTWLGDINNLRIIHDALPLIEDLPLYLDALNYADVWWEIGPERERQHRQYLNDPVHKKEFYEFCKKFKMDPDEFPRWDNIKHFDVYFRKEDEERVTRCLKVFSEDYRGKEDL